MLLWLKSFSTVNMYLNFYLEPLDRGFNFSAVSLADESFPPAVGVQLFVGFIGHEGLSNAHVAKLREERDSVRDVEGKVVEIIHYSLEAGLELGFGDDRRLKKIIRYW